ncbi:C39 family peptidase [Candidatus Berkelbacteria bacterium]|nr:C39 family peptidase [Candidatus Berkelbacteria bacterium]
MASVSYKPALGIIILAAIALGAVWYGIKHTYEKTGKFTASFDYLEKPLIIRTETSKSPESTQAPAQTAEASKTFLIEQVPFTSQAPHANWDGLHKETCEEASSLMAARYAKGERGATINPDDAEAELQRIIAWERETFGYFEDTNAEQTARILKEFYNLPKVSVRHDITLEDIKKEVGQGKLVIVPAAGRQLGNPFFTAPGPPYHMPLVVGYTRDQIITNDAGTKRGLGFRYDNDVFFNAIHDWTGNKDTIETGPKAMIVVG